MHCCTCTCIPQHVTKHGRRYPKPACRRPGDSDDEEGPQLSGTSGDESGGKLSKSGAALQRLLQKTGLDDASDDEDADDSEDGTPAPAPGGASACDRAEQGFTVSFEAGIDASCSSDVRVY